MSRSSRARRILAGPLGLVALAFMIGTVLFITGGSAHGQTAPVSTSRQDIAAGQQLYISHCESCHGFEGGGGQNGAPELINAGAAAADFYLTTGRMPLNNPGNQPLRHHPYFTPLEIRQLVAYINALPEITKTGVPGPGIPEIAPLCTTATPPDPNPTGCVTLAQGQAAYAINCAQCHQAGGAGGMLSKGNVVPGLGNSSLTQVGEAVRIGPKPMPVFGQEQLSDATVSAIAHYVQFLHDRNGPGGMGISHFGPVAEGFVASIFGFAVLLLAARMIGNRG